MEPIAIIIDALVVGALATGQDGATQASKEVYTALKASLVQHFGHDQQLADAAEKLEQRPGSRGRQEVLREELERVHAENEYDLVVAAQRFLALVEKQRAAPDRAAGEGNIAVEGNVHASILITGSGNTVNRGQPTKARLSPANQPTPRATEAIPDAALLRPPAQIKVLFLSADPIQADRLRLDQEMRSITQALRQADNDDRFAIRQEWAVRIDDLQALLLHHRPDIVHFSGHGNANSELILQDFNDEPVAVPSAALSQLFSLFNKHIRCVFLNACSSQAQAAAIAVHIDCVVGMSAAFLTDMTAIQFATAFYRALGYGQTVQLAFELGCSQLALNNLLDIDKAQLFGKAPASQVRFVPISANEQ